MLSTFEARCRERLANLTRDELIALAASGIAHDSEFSRRADKLLSVRAPLPQWCVSGVLLQEDLAPQILKWCLEPASAIVPLTCKAWLAAWPQLLIANRVVHPTSIRPLPLAEYYLSSTDNGFLIGLVTLPSGLACTIEANVCPPLDVARFDTFTTFCRTYNGHGERLAEVQLHDNAMAIATDGTSVFVTTERENLHKLRPTDCALLGTVRTWGQCHGLACKGGQVFCTGYRPARLNVVDAGDLVGRRQVRVPLSLGSGPGGPLDDGEDDSEDDISVDAEDSDGEYGHPCDVVEHGDKLIVAMGRGRPHGDDHGDDVWDEDDVWGQLLVCDVHGQQRRIVSVRGVKSAAHLCIVADRLYVSGSSYDDEEDEEDGDDGFAVVSLVDFEVVQVYHSPVPGTACKGICNFGGQLCVTWAAQAEPGAGRRRVDSFLFAGM